MKGKLIEVLGLKAEAGDDEIMALVTQGRVNTDFMDDLGELLSLKEVTPSTIKGAVLALKQSKDAFARLQGEVEALKAEQATEKARKNVDLALDGGKISPAQREWALNYATSDPAGFESFVANAPKVVPLKEKHPEPKGTEEAALSAEQAKVAQNMGITPDQFKTSRESLGI